MPIVYQATNKINGKRYIGVTKAELRVRIAQHVCAAAKGANLLFSKALRKYGREAFEFSILHEVASYDEVLRLEREIIARDRPEYNTAAGGRGPSGVKWSASRRAKIIPALLASWTPERRKRASQDAKSRVTPETIAAAKKRRPPVRFKKVVCLNDGKEFPGVKFAGSYYGVTNISAVLTGAQLTCGNGLTFAFAKDCLGEPDRQRLLSAVNARLNAAKKKRASGMRKRAVQCINTGETFPSATAASKAFGVAHSRVAQICNGEGHLRTGERFKWVDAECAPEVKRATPEQMLAAKASILAALSRGVETNRKKVVCLDTGKSHPSISDAAREHDVHVSALSASIYRKGRAAGLAFRFLEAAA